MNEYTMLVPTRLNDGTKVSEKKFRKLERKLIKNFNGYTDCGRVRGSWQNEEGKTFEDISRRYAVAAESMERVEAMAHYVAAAWDQEAIYIAQTSDRVEFIAN